MNRTAALARCEAALAKISENEAAAHRVFRDERRVVECYYRVATDPACRRDRDAAEARLAALEWRAA